MDATPNNPARFLMHVPVPWVFMLTYLLSARLESWRPLVLRPPAALLGAIAGGLLLAGGVVIAGWAQVIFRKARTTTVPGETSAKLVTWGPYRISRNPMYVGLVFAYLGVAGMLKQIWPVIMLPLIVAYLNWTVIPVEETRLDEAFHHEYEQYRLRVRRWV